MTPSDTFSLLFMLAFAGSVLGNLVAIYLLLTGRDQVVTKTPEQLNDALRVYWPQSDIDRLVELLPTSANCDCGEGGTP